MNARYNGAPCRVIGETHLEGIDFNMFYIQLMDGTTKDVPMFEVELVVVSVLEDIQATPISNWSDIK